MSLFDLININEKDFFSKNTIPIINDYEKKEFEDSFHIISKQHGLEFLFELNDQDKVVLDTIFIDNCRYTNDNLNSLLDIEKLNFSMSQDDIKNTLGEPVISGGGEKTLLGISPNWSKFSHNEFLIHFQFSQDNSCIDKVTISNQ